MLTHTLIVDSLKGPRPGVSMVGRWALFVRRRETEDPAAHVLPREEACWTSPDTCSGDMSQGTRDASDSGSSGIIVLGSIPGVGTFKQMSRNAGCPGYRDNQGVLGSIRVSQQSICSASSRCEAGGVRFAHPDRDRNNTRMQVLGTCRWPIHRPKFACLGGWFDSGPGHFRCEVPTVESGRDCSAAGA